MANSSSASFGLEVDVSGGLRNIQQFTRAVKRSAADIADTTFQLGGNKSQQNKFLSGLETEVVAVNKELEQALATLEQLEKKAKAGSTVPANAVPGLPAGKNFAQAKAFAQGQARLQVADVVGTRAATSGIKIDDQFRRLATALDQGFTTITTATIKASVKAARLAAGSNPAALKTSGSLANIQPAGLNASVFNQMVNTLNTAATKLNAATTAAKAAPGGGGSGQLPTPPIRGGGGNALPPLPGASSPDDQRRNAEELRRLRRDNSTQAVDLPGMSGVTADISRSEQGIIRFFERSGEGAEILTKADAKWRTAHQRLLDVSDTDAVTGKITARVVPSVGGKANVAQDKATIAADQVNLAQNLKQRRKANPEDFIKLGNGFTADISTPYIQLFRKIGEGVRRVQLDEDDAIHALESLFKKTTENANGLRTRSGLTEKQNADHLRQGASNGDFAQGVVPIGAGGVVADVRGAVLRLYKSTENGYEELKKDTEPYLKSQRALIRQTARGGNPGVLGSLAKGFSQGGFSGGGDHQGLIEGFAQSAGTTLKYSILGSTFYGLTKAIHQAGVELLDFNDSITELQVAGASVDPKFIDALSESAARAGTNVGEAMDVAAEGVRAFKSEIDAGKTSAEALGTNFAKQASIIAILTKTTLTDAAGNLKAIALAFNIPEQSFSRVTDLLAGAKQIGGGAEKETSQGLANIAVAFKQIGFSAEESGAIVSKVIAETDQGGTLVASRLTKISSIIGGASGQAALIKLNKSLPTGKKIEIGTDVQTATQIKELGAVFKTLDAPRKAALINSLGGTASAKELIVLLNNVNDLSKKAGDPSNFDGKGVAEYNLRLENLRSTLTQMQGEVKAIITTVATSGILQPVFDLVQHGLLPALRITRELAQGFGLIPIALRGGLGYLVTFLAAAKAIQLVNKNGGLVGTYQALERHVAPGTALQREALSAQQKDVLLGKSGPVQQKLAQEAAVVKAASAARLQAGRDLFRGDKIGENLGKAASGVGKAATGVGEAFMRATIAIEKFIIDLRLETATASLNAGGGLRGVGAGAAQGSKFVGRGIGQLGAMEVAGSTGLVGAVKGAGKGVGALLASELGPIGALLLTGIAVTGTIQAAHRIHTAVDDFNKLQFTPDTFGAAALAESANNLRASAATLRESSAGFFGTIVNAFNGGITGKLSNVATGVATSQDLAAGNIDARRKQAAQSVNGGNLSDVFQFTNDQAFTDSIAAVGNTGADSTQKMIAFQQALARLNSTTVTSLDAFDKYTLRQSANAHAAEIFGQLQSKALTDDRSGDGKGGKASSSGADEGAKYEAKNAAHKRVKDFANVDQVKLQSSTEYAVRDFLDSNGNPNDPAQQKQLSDAILANLKKNKVFGKDSKTANDVALAIAKQVAADATKIHSTADNSLSFSALSSQLLQYSSDAGAQAGVDSVIAGNPTGQSSDLVAANENLKQLSQGIETLKGKEGTPGYDADKVAALVEDLNKQKLVVAQASLSNLQSTQNLLDASIPAANTTQVLQRKYDDIQAQLDVPNLDQGTINDLKAQQAALPLQIAQSTVADFYSAARAGVDAKHSDGVDLTQSKNQNDIIAANEAEANLNILRANGTTGKALNDAIIAYFQAQHVVAEDVIDTNLATQLATLDPNSAVDSATAAVATATAALKKLANEDKNDAAYIAAVKAKQVALNAQTVTNLQATQLAGNLNIDLTNPVQVANKAVKDAQDDLALARKQKESPDVIVTKKLAVRNAQVSAESAAFSQFLTNVNNANTLGTISHQAYMGLLRGRADQIEAELKNLKLTDNQRQQFQDELIQLQTALKSGADELSGQFNLGDIKIPTPYEVRHALAQKDIGGVLGSNAPTSTAGNVTDDHSTRSVVLNGVPIQQVIDLIQNLFGIKVKTKTTRRTP